jgi:hypothetical protein
MEHPIGLFKRSRHFAPWFVAAFELSPSPVFAVHEGMLRFLCLADSVRSSFP